jgi:hypothetical protein
MKVFLAEGTFTIEVEAESLDEAIAKVAEEVDYAATSTNLGALGVTTTYEIADLGDQS